MVRKIFPIIILAFSVLILSCSLIQPQSSKVCECGVSSDAVIYLSEDGSWVLKVGDPEKLEDWYIGGYKITQFSKVGDEVLLGETAVIKMRKNDEWLSSILPYLEK